METAENTLRVLIIADNPLVRAGINAMLADQSDCLPVAQLAPDSKLSDQIDTYQAEVIIWDLGWEPAHSLEHLADLRESGLPVLVLLSDEEQALRAWSAGAKGLLPQDAAPADLIAALTAIAQGLIVLDPTYTSAILQTADELPELPEQPLTPREYEVLECLAEGLTNKGIALKLSISEHTVKFHINAILTKLHAQSRTEAVVRAARFGLLTL